MWTEVDTIKLLPISPRRNKVSGLFKTIQKEYIWKEFCGCMSAATMQLKKVQSEEKNWNKLLRTVQFNMPFRESFQKKTLCDFKLAAVGLRSLCIKWCMTFTIQETLFHMLDLLRSIHGTRGFGKLHHHAGRIWLWFKHCQRSEVFWTTNHRQPHLIETNSDPTRGEPLNWKYRIGCDGRSCNNSYRAVLLAIFEPNSLWPPKHIWLKILKSCHISASPLLSTEPSQNIDPLTSLQEDYSTVLKMLQ